MSTPLAKAILFKVFCTKNSITTNIINTSMRAARIRSLLVPEFEVVLAGNWATAVATGAGGT